VGDAPARLVPGISASSELFGVLGAHAALGRTFDPKDDVQGAELVAVISHGLWQELGGDRSIIGQRHRFDGIPRTVVGVMPRGFWFPSPTVRVWFPEPLDPEQRSGNFALVGRLAAGSDMGNMSGQISQFTRMLGERFEYPEQWDKTRDPWVRSIRDSLVRPMRPALVATLVAMGMILLIACANVAALMLGQVEGRTTELAVRSALGANRRRLTNQLVSEALLLGLASGGVGAVLGAISFRLLVAALPLGAWAETASLDWTVFAVAIVVAIGAALLISLVPTISLWRGRLRGAIGTGRTDGVTGRGVRLESGLVIAEVALAVLMTAGAGVLVRSVGKLYEIDPGLETRGVGVVDVVLPSDLTTPQQKRMLSDLLDGVRGVPGVKSAAVVQHLPLRGSSWSSGIEVAGRPEPAVTTTFVRLVSRDYFATMGIAVRQGRTFEASDVSPTRTDTSESAIVINEALAKKYFEGQNPIGGRITDGFTRRWARVVGVVADVAEGDLTDAAAPARYSPYESFPLTPSSQTLVFKTTAELDPIGLLQAVRGAVQRASPRVAIQQTTTMEQVLAKAVGPVRQVMTLISLLTALALVLGAVGIYGVISHFVARRKRDWGIRIALGLSPSRVVGGVVGRGVSLVVAGIGIGLVGFVVSARLLSSLLYGVGATDPIAIAGAVLALLLVGALAALVPAARASRTDPAIVLRDQ
jgi:putative ABC transport system permease protein